MSAVDPHTVGGSSVDDSTALDLPNPFHSADRTRQLGPSAVPGSPSAIRFHGISLPGDRMFDLATTRTLIPGSTCPNHAVASARAVTEGWRIGTLRIPDSGTLSTGGGLDLMPGRWSKGFVMQRCSPHQTGPPACHRASVLLHHLEGVDEFRERISMCIRSRETRLTFSAGSGLDSPHGDASHLVQPGRCVEAYRTCGPSKS